MVSETQSPPHSPRNERGRPGAPRLARCKHEALGRTQDRTCGTLMGSITGAGESHCTHTCVHPASPQTPPKPHPSPASAWGCREGRRAQGRWAFGRRPHVLLTTVQQQLKTLSLVPTWSGGAAPQTCPQDSHIPIRTVRSPPRQKGLGRWDEEP